ncbi:hypothetical protein O0I10_004136 [Lichtheimia ornata]|uniref:Protein AF-9 homolog n=1 Tax=Lichtheimia ornata TaxID=688661 RepID=A0AAD7XX20_9FUNG|nr:uncharacterized protein O0I10_004136 [Lichtheimia ornata]KAJ8660274.1 hypothetical protein O0I10_004136 [Lichtheimia ornata]
MEPTLDIKITFQNSIIKGPDAQTVEGHPLRNWKIKLVAVENGKDKKGRLSELLDHVEYILHPTFENPRRVVTKEPYVLQEKGWGEFDMRIVLNFANNVATEVLLFDLSFMQSSYSVIRTVVFQNPTQELLALLRSSHGGRKRRANSLEKSSSSIANKKIRSPANAATARPREIEPGAATAAAGASSMSPSTPMFATQQQQQPNAGYSSNYSISPQSFASPSAATSGMLTSPYDYTRSIKTPQAEYDNHHHPHHNNHHYMSDLSDTDERPATVPTHQGGGGGRSESSGGSSYGNTYDGRNNNNHHHHHRPQQNGYGKHHHGSSSSSENSNTGEDNDHKHDGNGQEAHIVDDVYTESDLDHVNPIHGSDMSPDMRRAWGIPDNVNMLELARRLSNMDTARLADIQELIEKWRTDEMIVEEKEDEVVMDLYSLGPELLTRLWEYCQS